MLNEIEANPMPIKGSMNEILANLHELSTCLTNQLQEISTLIAQAHHTHDTSKVFTTDETPANVGEVASLQQTRDDTNYLLNKCVASEKQELERNSKLKGLTHGDTITKPITKVAETPQRLAEGSCV